MTAVSAIGQTLAQKIIARAAGRDRVMPGEIVTVGVDLAMAHDSSGPRRWRARLEELGVGLWDPQKVVIASDHYVPATDAASAAILAETRAFVRDYGVAHFYDMEGICHALLPERGHLRPGLFVAGGDSHTPMAGAFGCYAAGFGATDMTAIAATGETWTRVPETVRVEWAGGLSDGLASKDMMLFLCKTLGLDHSFQAIEYGGPAVAAMAMPERMVLSNMAAELGFETGMIEPDQVTLDHIAAHGGTVEMDALEWRSDPDAEYRARHAFDASTLMPQVAAPHSPANTDDAEAFKGTAIHQAYIGACVGAKLEDLRMAARVLCGKRIAPGVRLLIAPASTRITSEAAAEGTLTDLLNAGATLLPSGCGACAGMGAGIPAAGDVVISTTNRNFKGRMGNDDAFVYLASPYTVAASALTGTITDPRAILADVTEAA